MMMWDGPPTRAEIGALEVKRLVTRIIVEPPHGWRAAPLMMKWRYPHRVTLDCAAKSPEAMSAISFERFRPAQSWWLEAAYSRIHFYFRTEEDAMMFRMAVL